LNRHSSHAVAAVAGPPTQWKVSVTCKAATEGATLPAGSYTVKLTATLEVAPDCDNEGTSTATLTVEPMFTLEVIPQAGRVQCISDDALTSPFHVEFKLQAFDSENTAHVLEAVWPLKSLTIQQSSPKPSSTPTVSETHPSVSVLTLRDEHRN
jgi:hypothetical protein